MIVDLLASPAVAGFSVSKIRGQGPTGWSPTRASGRCVAIRCATAAVFCTRSCDCTTATSSMTCGGPPWSDRLMVRGEIEVSNVDRFDVVVRAAVAAGASTVDLSGVEFYSAAAVRALFGAADLLHERGRPLILHDPQVSHVKALALEFLAAHPAVELTGKKGG